MEKKEKNLSFSPRTITSPSAPPASSLPQIPPSSEHSHLRRSLEKRLKGFREMMLSGLLHNYQSWNATGKNAAKIAFCFCFEPSLNNQMLVASTHITSWHGFLVCSLLTYISLVLFFFFISQLFYEGMFRHCKASHYQAKEAGALWING